MSEAVRVEAEKYAAWFAWARGALGRTLDATHAAALAAYDTEAAGGSQEDAQAAAYGAGSEPARLDAETMAIAEWAAWAGGTLGAAPSASLIAARYAVARVAETHDLDGVMREVSDVLAARGPSPPSGRRNRRLWIIGGIAAAVLVLGGATAGLVGYAIQASAVPSAKPGQPGPAGLSVNVDFASGDAAVDAWDLPPDTPTFLFVGDETVRILQTDGNGRFETTIAVPPGTSRVAVCLDSFGESCPASTVVTRP